MSCRADVEIAAPPDRIFPYLYEPEKLLQWVPGLSAVERRGGQGQPSVGERVVCVFEFRGRRHEVESETTRIEPNQILEGRTLGRGWESRGLQELEPLNGHTRVTVTCDYTITAFFVRPLAPLLEWQAGRKLPRNLARLKQAVEAET